MITSLYTADVKLNETDKNYKKCLLLINDNGILMIDEGLFSTWFENGYSEDTEVINKKHLKDIVL